MLRPYLIIMLACLMCLDADICRAQKIFTEGVLVYTLTIDPPANQEGVVQYTGTYTVTIKGSQVKKEIKLDNGFENTLVTDYANHKAYSLKKMGDKLVAIQLDLQQLEERNRKYEHFTVKLLKDTRTVGGTEAVEAVVKYEKDNKLNIYVAKDWQLATQVFEHFPGIKELPVVFTYSGDEGLATHFSLQKIAETPVENAAFTIPPHIKVISSEEYKNLKN